MDSTYSTTQTTNIASIVGIVALLLNHFNVNIGSDELTLVIGSALAIGGVISNWYHRYQQGDLTFTGKRI